MYRIAKPESSNRTLVRERLQLPGIRHFETTELRLPFVEFR